MRRYLVIFLYILGFSVPYLINSNHSLYTFLYTSGLIDYLDNYLKIGRTVLVDTLTIFVIWSFITALIFLLSKAGKDVFESFIHDFRKVTSEKYKLNATRILVIFTSLFSCLSVFGYVIFKIYRGEAISNSPVVFLFIIATLLSAFLLLDISKKIRILSIRGIDIVITVFLIVLCILTLGFNLRFPKEMVADEAASWETVRHILRGEYKADIFSYGYYGYPAFNVFVQAGLLRLLHFTDKGIEGWRFTAVPMAALAVVGVYFLTRNLFNKKIAVLSSLLLLVNPYFMILSRISFPTNQSIIPPLYTVLFAHVGVTLDSLFYISLAGIFSGLGYYVYPSAKISVIIGVLILLYYLFTQKSKRGNLTISLVYLFSFILTATPVILSGWVYKANEGNRIYQSSVLSVDFLKSVYPNVSKDQLTSFYPLRLIGDKYRVYFHPIAIPFAIRNVIVSIVSLFQAEPIYDLNFRSSIGGTEWGFAIFTGFLAVLYRLVKGREKTKYILILIWFSVSMIILGGIFGAAQFWRLEPILPILAIFSGIGLYPLYICLRKLTKGYSGVFIFSAFIAFLLSVSMYRYFKLMRIPYSEEKEFEWDLSYAVNDAKKNDMVYYIYDIKEGIKYGGGILFNYMHLDDSRYASIPINEVENILKRTPTGKIFFYYLKDYNNLTNKLTDYHGQDDKLYISRSKKDNSILYYRYSRE
ncbi:hypothetical protein A2960_03250 [Candidatus Gottesmanbacteria bacterium RIFCSPLOWO2_01_FULL_39_12b]|uniref:Glycosyltransferase RgtA/B/C/D-like domain-containing protein n=1 Tax=Candidatus Gottesmanbacteria bacterium RIFCSPLOWO2_01_FULL_39_12b TaxID=1798388 RepID=A0A1F6ARS7_9BACT|nr:MAG: hypothetical protein A2960_03250 [Candidatus Gottesmanbacteria bacterium RIFCSPLOWO2_01_FULL_39_12b]